jgi:sugar lactone lactonase YvrE
LTTYTPAGKSTKPTITGLDEPFGVALDAAGNIYITGDGGVTTYKKDGKPTTPTIGGFDDSVGIAVH